MSTPKKPSKPQARASWRFEFGSQTVSVPMVELEYQYLLTCARQAMSGDPELETLARERLKELAAHVARSKLDSINRSNRSAGPRIRTSSGEARLARMYWDYVAQHGKYGAQKHFLRVHDVKISTLKKILEKYPLN